MARGAEDRGGARAVLMGGLLFMGSVLTALPGCSVYMATAQPGEKDVSVLKEGTPRSHVIATLGAPVWSGEKGGAKVDPFAFKQGYSKGAKAGRAIFHAVADVFTLGLWEVLGTPIEAIASGTDTKVEVTYDGDERVKKVETIGPKEEETPNAGSSQPQQVNPSP